MTVLKITSKTLEKKFDRKKNFLFKYPSERHVKEKIKFDIKHIKSYSLSFKIVQYALVYIHFTGVPIG